MPRRPALRSALQRRELARARVERYERLLERAHTELAVADNRVREAQGFEWVPGAGWVRRPRRTG